MAAEQVWRFPASSLSMRTRSDYLDAARRTCTGLSGVIVPNRGVLFYSLSLGTPR